MFKNGNPGKQKGTILHKTKAWNELGDFFTKAGAEKAMNIMMNSKEDKFMKYYILLLEYFKPKHQRIEHIDDPNAQDKTIIVLPSNGRKDT